jgi:hypothetical protein
LAFRGVDFSVKILPFAELFGKFFWQKSEANGRAFSLEISELKLLSKFLSKLWESAKG